MNSLIPISQSEINNELVQTANARELHAYLNVATRFNDWIVCRISEYNFIENQDYVSFTETPVKGRPRKEYHITIDMAKELSMVERNEKGREARQYFIECEKLLKQAPQQPKLPQSYEQALEALLGEVRANNALTAENKALTHKIADDAPKLECYEDIMGSNDLVSFGELAKILAIKSMGRNKLFAKLRELGVLRDNNEPYQTYVDRGWFKLVETKFTKPNGDICINLKTMVYQKGVEGVRKLVLAELEVTS